MNAPRRLSLTVRLTLLFACTSVGVLLALGLVIGALVQQHFEELDLETLKGKLELAQHALHQVPSRANLEDFAKQLGTSLVGHPGLEMEILDANGKALLGTSALQFPSALLQTGALGQPSRPVSWVAPNGKHFRGLALRAAVGADTTQPLTIAVGMDMSPHDHFMKSFQTALWSAVVLAALLSGLLGWAAVRRELRPLRTIRQRASEITANRLDQRLTTEAVPAEMEELVQSLNAMLARLEESFRRLSDFSSDLAHELRTPVTNLRTQTQVILSKPRTADRYRDVLYSNAEEFERLSRMISDMLFLAKSEHGLVAPGNEEIDLAAEIRDLFSFFEALADGGKIALTLDGAGQILGDKMLIRRALTNVLTNAIRHTPPNGRVHVTIESGRNEGAVRLCIDNTGEPIPEHLIPRLFDRFFRAVPVHDGATEGAGLGLAITKSIVDLHGGTIGVHCRDGITRFDMHFPPCGRKGAGLPDEPRAHG